MTDEGCGSCGACTGAVTVTAPGSRFTRPLSPHVNTGSCGGAGSEAYLTFTLGTASDVFITTHGTGIDTVLYVRECSCTGMEVACNDDADGLTTSMLRLNALAPGNYNLFVDTKAAMSADVDVDLYITAPGAASDRCGNPTFIAAGTTAISGNTCTFNHDQAAFGDMVDCTFTGGGAGEDRIYYFYVPTTRTVTFDGCNSATNYDTTIYVRNVCTNTSGPAQVACNDDGCGGMPDACDGGYRSSVTQTLSPGLYHFFADGYFETAWPCPCGDYQYDLIGI